MPRNGSGSYSLPQSPFVAGTTISSASVNSDLSDIATALTGSLPRDGQAGMSGQLKVPDGSVLAPALSFNNESNTGFVRSATNTVGLVVGGVQIATFAPTTVTFTATEVFGSFQGGVDAGMVIDFAGAAAQVPAGWILCFGQAISRTTFPLLFAAIGVIWGAGDGVTTFNLPDFRDYTLVGKGDMGGSDAGRLTTAFFGSSPTVLANAGGAQTSQLINSNLPAYTPSGSISVTGHVGVTGVALVNSGGITTVAGLAGSTPLVVDSQTFTGNAQGGSSAQFANVPPSIIVNKIIYTGG